MWTKKNAFFSQSHLQIGYYVALVELNSSNQIIIFPKDVLIDGIIPYFVYECLELLGSFESDQTLHCPSPVHTKFQFLSGTFHSIDSSRYNGFPVAPHLTHMSR